PFCSVRLEPVTVAARNKVAAPIAEPATRKLQGLSSRKATAAAIQFRPQAKASSTTKSLAVVAASPFVFGYGIALETLRSGSGITFACAFASPLRAGRGLRGEPFQRCKLAGAHVRNTCGKRPRLVAPPFSLC